MSLIAIGISHKTAPLEVREKFSFTKAKTNAYLRSLKRLDSVLGIIILSTCNRTEIYCDTTDADLVILQLKDFFTRHFWLDEDKVRYFYFLRESDVIGHIFKVACGLDSQVLGETEILGQVKAAQETAIQAGATCALLDRLFIEAVNIGREVRVVTKISQGNVSVGSAAIKMLEEQFGGIQNKSILVIGTGKIGALVCNYLKQKNVKGIFVSNRTYAKASELALFCGGKAVNFKQLKDELNLADIVISATSSPHIVLPYNVLQEIMQLRSKPLVIMDLALPRDVDPQAKNIPGISLFTLDDLKSVVEENYAKRQEEAKSAHEIILKKVSNFADNNLLEVLNVS